MPFPRVVPHSDGAGVVDGVLGGVGSLASQLATWGGARVIATVRRPADIALVDPAVARDVIAIEEADAVDQIRSLAPRGVDRIIEVSFADNVDLDAAVARNNTVIAAYATGVDRPDFPFWPMLFNNVTMRLLGSDDFPAEAKQHAARDLTHVAHHLHIPTATPVPLSETVDAHERVDAGSRARVLVDVRAGSTESGW